MDYNVITVSYVSFGLGMAVALVVDVILIVIRLKCTSSNDFDPHFFIQSFDNIATIAISQLGKITHNAGLDFRLPRG